ncbi:MAG TPA: hypothetical protein VIU44_03960 [Gaiellaceae bacterium]
MRRLVFLPLLALVLAACGGKGGSPLGSETGQRGTTAAITPTTSNNGVLAESTFVIQAAANGAPRFSVRILKVPAGTVQLLLNNPSKVPHDLVVEGHGVHAKGAVVTETTSPADRSRVTVSLKPGRYVFYSDVGSDRARGMHGVLLVGALK